MRVIFPIHYKFLLVTTLLLVFSVISYLALATHIFKRDKVELIYDLNRSRVIELSLQFTTLLRGVTDQIRIATILSQAPDAHAPDVPAKLLLADILSNGANIIYLAQSRDLTKEQRALYIDKNFSETYDVNESFFTQRLGLERPVPFARIIENGSAVWNASVKGGPPLIGFGKYVHLAENGRRTRTHHTYTMIAYIRADKLLQMFNSSSLGETLAVNQDGQVLVSHDADKMLSAISIEKSSLYKAATQNGGKTGVLQFKEGGREILAAHAITDDKQIYILSQTDGRQVYSAVEDLIKRTILFAAMIVTLAFIIATVFSRSVTWPLKRLTEAMNEVIKSGELGDGAIEVKTRDEISLLASSFNNMIRDLKISRDELRTLNRELEQKVKDRTLRLKEQNQAVKVAQEALLQSTRLATVGEVAGRAAHEVLNPLTSLVARLERVRSRLESESDPEIQILSDIVIGWEADLAKGGFENLVSSWRELSTIDPSLTLWQEDFENVKRVQASLTDEISTALKDVDFVLKESQRINKIVQNMRSLSRVHSDEKIVSMNQLMNRAVKIMADFGEQYNVRFNEQYAACRDLVRLDSDEFLQCATNLLRNSIQAIGSRNLPDGEGLIEITTYQAGGNFVIEIADNGIGIDTANKQKLFNVQFSTKSTSEGTGLGLTITRRLIRSFGGEIELIDSRPGEGCQFKIRLPLQEPGTETEKQRVAI